VVLKNINEAILELGSWAGYISVTQSNLSIKKVSLGSNTDSNVCQTIYIVNDIQRSNREDNKGRRVIADNVN